MGARLHNPMTRCDLKSSTCLGSSNLKTAGKMARNTTARVSTGGNLSVLVQNNADLQPLGVLRMRALCDSFFAQARTPPFAPSISF